MVNFSQSTAARFSLDSNVDDESAALAAAVVTGSDSALQLRRQCCSDDARVILHSSMNDVWWRAVST